MVINTRVASSQHVEEQNKIDQVINNLGVTHQEKVLRNHDFSEWVWQNDLEYT